MSDQARFEVYDDEGRWTWRFVDGDSVVAGCAQDYGGSMAARRGVDRTRAAADVEGELDGLAGERGQFEVAPGTDGHWHWRLVLPDGTVVARTQVAYERRDEAVAAAAEFRELAVGATPVYLVHSEDPPDPDPFRIGIRDGSLLRSLASLPFRARRHRRFLDGIDTRIVVMGARGKSSTTRRLDDVFNRRGYDTLTKITGNHPVTIHNGRVVPLDRVGPRTTLYENIRVFAEFAPQLDRFSPEDVAVLENQGITEYTTRLVNERFVRPHVAVLTNVRQDHQETLGEDRQRLARAFARSVPEGTHLVCGEQHPVLYEYIEREVERRGGTAEQVDVPERHRGLIAAETVHAIDHVLRYLDEETLPTSEVDAYLEAAQPAWEHLLGGRIFDAAQVNDVESTEAVRQSLVSRSGDDVVTPFVYLRADRRGRTASFADYVDLLAGRGAIEEVHVGGRNTRPFARAVDVPATRHSHEADPGAVLDELFEAGHPVVLMGNTVDEFMREMERTVGERAAAYEGFDAEAETVRESAFEESASATDLDTDRDLGDHLAARAWVDD